MIFIAILGHGVVGSGVAEVLHNNAAGIAAKAGEPIRVKRILDLRRRSGSRGGSRSGSRGLYG